MNRHVGIKLERDKTLVKKRLKFKTSFAQKCFLPDKGLTEWAEWLILIRRQYVPNTAA
jgi:hypothetical protein